MRSGRVKSSIVRPESEASEVMRPGEGSRNHFVFLFVLFLSFVFSCFCSVLFFWFCFGFSSFFAARYKGQEVIKSYDDE